MGVCGSHPKRTRRKVRHQHPILDLRHRVWPRHQVCEAGESSTADTVSGYQRVRGVSGWGRRDEVAAELP
jgi:hypothetical protein